MACLLSTFQNGCNDVQILGFFGDGFHNENLHFRHLNFGEWLSLLQGFYYCCGRRGGLMVSALDSGASGPGSSPGRGHCVVFLGKTLNSHSASLHPGV